MIPLDMIPKLIRLEEAHIQKLADMNGPDNTFKTLIAHGIKLKQAGLEPIYVMTPDQNSFAVSCDETYGKRLH